MERRAAGVLLGRRVHHDAELAELVGLAERVLHAGPKEQGLMDAEDDGLSVACVVCCDGRSDRHIFHDRKGRVESTYVDDHSGRFM